MKKLDSKEDLLAAGLEILTEHGPDGLRIEPLCRRLGVTKGSFYHHFANRDAFFHELLSFWVRRNTLDIIDEVNRASGSLERRMRMVREAMAMPAGPDEAVRAWGLRSEIAAWYVAKADALRREYLSELFLPFVDNDPVRADLTAALTYAAHLGARMMVPPVSDEEYAAMVDFINDALNLPAMSRDDGDGSEGG